jgi:anti-sigma factor (TIGR02949 family)
MTDESDKHDVIDTDCLEAFDHLYAYLNGELHNEFTLSKIEHHLSHCKSCFSRAQMERELNTRIKEAGASKTPDALKTRLKKLIKDF